MTKDDELTLYSAQLPNTPGWVAFTPTEKEWIQLHTSNANRAYRLSGANLVRSCMELAQIEEFLKGKPMTMTNWLRTSYEASEITGRRMLAWYKNLRRDVPDEALMYLADNGLVNMSNNQRSVLDRVLKKLPPPKDKRSYPLWKNKVEEGITEDQSKRGKGEAILALEEDDALLLSVASVDRYMRQAKIGGASALPFMKKMGGYVMQRRGIPRSVTIERTPIPDGFFPKRGAPPGPRKKKK